MSTPHPSGCICVRCEDFRDMLKRQNPDPSSQIIRWQRHQMDRAILMLPVGSQAPSGSFQCAPTGPAYVLAVDHDAEIGRYRAALKKYGHHTHPHCHDLKLASDGQVIGRNGCLCGFDAQTMESTT